MILNKEALLNIMPIIQHPDDWLRPLNDAMDRFEISENVLRVSAFLGQITHESNQCNYLQENLIYSPRRILEVWPKQFKNLEEAQPFARNPEKLANRVYANRLGNGPEYTGDGFTFRGRGLIQITGRANYERIAELIDLPNLVQMPDKLLNPLYAAMSAAAFWSDKGLNEMADKMTRANVNSTVAKITKKINGGKHGLDRRREFTKVALGELDLEFAA